MNAPASTLAAQGMSRHAQSAFAESADHDRFLATRLASSSIDKIGGLITELQEMQETLRSEAARVQREVGNYEQMVQTALAATKTITNSLAALATSANSAGGTQTFPAGHRSGGRERLKRWPAPAIERRPVRNFLESSPDEGSGSRPGLGF